MKSARPGRGSDQFPLRLPDGMRDRIAKSAEDLGRSMNSEIVQRLARSFEEDNQENLKLDLPAPVWNALMADAHIHGQMMEERAIQLLEGLFGKGDDIFDEPTAYTRALDQIRKIENENIELGDRYSHMRESMDYDFILYFNKVTQLDQFASVILSESQAVPDRLRTMAEQIADVTKAEIAMFKDRHKYAVYHQKRRDGALLESENADGTARGIENLTYGEVEEYTRTELADLWEVPATYLDILVRLDALHVRRAVGDEHEFTMSKRSADRFMSSEAGKRLIDGIKPSLQRLRDAERAAKGDAS